MKNWDDIWNSPLGENPKKMRLEIYELRIKTFDAWKPTREDLDSRKRFDDCIKLTTDCHSLAEKIYALIEDFDGRSPKSEIDLFRISKDLPKVPDGSPPAEFPEDPMLKALRDIDYKGTGVQKPESREQILKDADEKTERIAAKFFETGCSPEEIYTELFPNEKDSKKFGAVLAFKERLAWYKAYKSDLNNYKYSLGLGLIMSDVLYSEIIQDAGGEIDNEVMKQSLRKLSELFLGQVPGIREVVDFISFLEAAATAINELLRKRREPDLVSNSVKLEIYLRDYANLLHRWKHLGDSLLQDLEESQKSILPSS